MSASLAILAAIYLGVALVAAFSLGRGVNRGDWQEATFALLYCTLWPVGVALLLGSLAGTKSRDAQGPSA